MESFFSQVIAKIAPDKDVVPILAPTIENIQRCLDSSKLKANAEIGGSIGKGTYLRNDFDCDVFILFDRKMYTGKPISDILEKALSSLALTRVHGSRDYFQLQHDGVNFEIIPVLQIDDPSQAENITDCSPLHVKWVKKFHKGDEIRLTKAFCKAAGAYGAESYIGGFSGHVIDILTIYYGSFEKLMHAASSWKISQVIDINDVYKGDISSLNVSKLSPLIVIDPIDPSRNAAAALSEKRLMLFIQHAQRFLKKPDESFFIRKEFSLKELRFSSPSVIVELSPLGGKRDVVGAKLLKCAQYLASQLGEAHFSLIDWDWHWKQGQNAYCWFVFKDPPIADEVLLAGPPERSFAHVKAFKEKHPSAYVDKKRVFAKEKPEFSSPRKALAHFLKSAYIAEKIHDARLLD